MDFNQAIQVLRNAIDCIECEDCVRECCTYYDMAINKDSMLAALDLAIKCIEKYADLRSCGAKSRPIDADRLCFILQKNFGHTAWAEVMQQIINAQPTLDDVIEEQGHEIRLVIDGLKDLIIDRKSFVQEKGDIFSRDIQILERAIALIQNCGANLAGMDAAALEDEA